MDWSDDKDGYTTELAGELPASSLSMFERQLNDSGSGSIRIKDGSGVVQDLVGWGEAAPCSEVSPTSNPGSDNSLHRYSLCDSSELQDTNNNQEDFAVNQTPAQGDLSIFYPDSCVEDGDQGGALDPNGELTCEDVEITELLPSPSGPDSTDEFIELHNPTDEVIPLLNCALQTSTNSLEFNFSDIEFQPGQYMAFYSGETGLNLSGGGGTVWLLSPSEDLHEVQFGSDLGDDVAWAWFEDDGWQQTYSPTPGAENIKQLTKPCPAGQERSEETGRCRSLSVGGGSDLKPCRPDQFRNPLTNRCKLKDSDSGLKPCRADQSRNPETNRCRLITTASSTLKPCNPDQFRNPATNRCKKIDSGNTLKPCKSNQERNPETNRCRKVRGASSTDDLPKVKDIEAPIVSGNYSWILAGIAGGGMLAYAGWEWRRELLALLSRLKP
jgi:hypothetical protein